MNWNYWLYVFAGFRGRINREPFWIACGVLALIGLAAELLAWRVEGDTLDAILSLVFTYPEFAVAIKRANDRNLSPWLVALAFAGSVAFDLSTLLNGPIDTDSLVIYLIMLPFAILGLALFIELGFRRGTEGPNRFGPDPLSA